jgi:PAS domain S-box-containing protein
MSSWTFEQKIKSCFAAIFLMIAFFSWMSSLGFSKMNRNFEAAAGSTARKIRLAGDLDTTVDDMHAAERGVLLYSLEKNVIEVEHETTRFDNSAALVNKDIAALRPLVSDEQESQAIDVLDRANAKWRSVFPEIERNCTAGNVEEASKLEAQTAIPLFNELDETTDKLLAIELNLLTKDRERAAETLRLNRLISFGLSALAFLVCGLAFIVVRRINATLLNAKDAAEAHAVERQFELSLIRSIHEGSPDGIVVVNGEGIVVSHNRRFLDVWQICLPGAPNESLESAASIQDSTILSKAFELVEEPDAFMKRVLELYDDPDANDHCEVKLRDGRTLERHSTGLRGPAGKYLGRVWFFRDITVHKQAEISLQDANDLADGANRRLLAERLILNDERNMLRALIDNIPDFMYVKDLEGRFVVANYHLARAVGVLTPDELLGKTDFDYYPREVARACYEDEQSVIRSGQALQSYEEKLVDHAGNDIYVLTTKVPLRDNEGNVIGIAGTGHDISVRKKMEQALVEAERSYRGIFEKAIVGIFQCTPEGRLLSVNPSMAFTFGFDSPEEMVATISDISQQFFVNPKRGQEFMLVMDRVGGVKNFECEAFCKDGRKIWITMSIRAIRKKGVVLRYEGMSEDITERNLLREQLYQAQKLESVGQLAAGIAHEINTPTQYIGDNVRFLKDAFVDLNILLTSYGRLLSAAKEEKLSREDIEHVVTEVERADAGYLLAEIPKAIDQTLEGVTRVSTLVSAMKEFSHPGTKEKIPLDLNHAIDSTITIARNEWKYLANLETDFDPSLPPVVCQPGEFNQVILNLIVNAAHAIGDVAGKSGSGMGTISVQTRNCPECAEIRIQDTGSGIPESVQPRIFDPFFTTKEIGKGTGQGLAIARSVVVDRHNGSIRFETEAGKGTTFIIRLPYDGKAFTVKKVHA